MSADIAVFHSDEADDSALLPGVGWYVGSFHGDVLVTDGAYGPFPTEAEALAAIGRGDWLGGGVLPKTGKNE